jgi:phage terminase large subunit GpA-like protein
VISPEHVLYSHAAEIVRVRELPDPVDWCAKNVTIHDKGESHYRGPFSLEDSPDSKEILRAMCGFGEFEHVETVVEIAPTQALKTTKLMGAGAYTLKHRPADLTWVMDSADNARNFSKERWQPMVEVSRFKSEIMPDDPDALTNMALAYRTGTLRFAGANSPGKVASFPASTVVGDEVDKYPPRVRNEAGTLDLVTERMSGAFSFRRWLASTPTVALGTIWVEAHKGDCRRYHVPCIHCGKEFVWSFAQLRWDEGAKGKDGRWDMLRVEKTAHYQCPHCEKEIWENHRRDMMHAGRWVATEPNPADPRRVSYFRNCFHVLHPRRTFARIAQKHLEAGRDPSARQNFTNSWLGEVAKEESLTVAAMDVHARAEAYLEQPKQDGDKLVLPAGVLVLTAGVDVQESPPRLEAEIVGHGELDETWGVEYRVFLGDPSAPQVWDELDRWLLKRWLHPGGFVLSPAAVCIDTGYLPDVVYRFCQPRLGRYVFATKGSSGGYGEPLVSRARKSGVHALPLFMVGTTTAKEMVYTRLQVTTPGAGFCHFPKEPKRGYDAAYFRMLTAEQCHVVWKGGRRVKKFVNPSGRRNEALDIRCLALAAKELRNPDLAVIAEQMRAEPEPPPVEPAVATFDMENGKIERPAPPPEPSPPPSDIQSLPANTYRPIATAAVPKRVPIPKRRNWATSW